MGINLRRIIQLEPENGAFTSTNGKPKGSIVASEWKRGDRIPGTEKYQWHSQKTGEVREQIGEPGTPSKEKPHAKYVEKFSQKPDVIKSLSEVKVREDLTQRAADKLIEDFCDEEDHSEVAKDIAEWSGIYVEKNNTMFSSYGDKVNGGIVWSKSGKQFEVKGLFSGAKGVGTLLMAKAIKKNMSEQDQLVLTAVESAVGFYSSIGMTVAKKKSDGAMLMKMSGEDALEFANGVLGAVKPRDVYADRNNRRMRDAGVKEVVDRIVKKIRNHGMAKDMIDKVVRYWKTKNDRDDLSLREQRILYDGEETVEPLTKKRKIDISWEPHAMYRRELRDIDPEKVNKEIKERIVEKLNPPQKKDVRFKEPGVGTFVVEYDTTRDPVDVDVITVWAQTRRGKL